MPGSCAWRAAGIRVVSAVSLVVAALGKVVADEGVVFDAQVLKARGIDPQLAQYFRLAPRFEQGERQVTLEVNGTAKGRTHARFNENGELCADSSLLASAGIHAPERTLQAPDTGGCLLFTQAIPEAVVRLLPGKEEVALRVPTHTLLSRGPIQRSFSNGGSAGLLNYDALLVNRQSNGQSSQYRNFSSLIGLNAGDWIVRSRQSYSAFEGTGRAEHLYAYAEHTWEKHQTRMQLGHLTLAAPLLAGGAFTGVQLQPETALSAMANEGIGSNTIVDGVAFSPARVEVRQSGVVIYTTLVPSGPFTLSGLPLLSLNLDLEVTVQEDSGSQHQFTVPSATLRRGNNAGPSGYTLALGQVRRFGSDDRETPLFAAATNSWRWRANTHLSAGLMGADQYQAFGWGLQQALSEHTTISAQHVFSSTPAVQLRGSQLQASLSTALGRSVSAGLTASQQTEGFRTLTDTAWNEKRRAPESRASQQLSASVSGTLENLGTLGAVVSRNATTNGQAQSRLGLSWSSSVFKNTHLSLRLERNFGASVQNSPGTAAFFSLSLALGQRRSLSHYARHDGANGLRTGAQLSEQVDDTLSYTVGVDRAAAGQVDMNGRLSLLPRYTSVDLGYTRSGAGATGYDAAMSGGLAIHAEGITPSPYWLRDTFGLVKVGDEAGVKLRTPQGPVWTDGAGRAIVASLPAYRTGRIEIETASLPRNFDVLNGYQEVEAGRGSVQAFDFSVISARRVLLMARRADGRPVTQGVGVYDHNQRYLTTVVDAGKIFLVDARPDMQLQLTLPDGASCRLNVSLAQKSEASALFETAESVCEEA
nr:fimbria/pilus outer membrane usher protein [Pseudomonas umsongensis]